MDGQGRLWSQYLESFLVPDGKWLRLYDNMGQRRLTQAEAETQWVEASERRAEALAREKEVIAQEKEALLQKTEALAEKLRSLGINPDEL